MTVMSEHPQTLPLLPLRNGRVLFPGLVLRMQIKTTSGTRAAALMEQIGERHSRERAGSGPGVLVACVPVTAENAEDPEKPATTGKADRANSRQQKEPKEKKDQKDIGLGDFGADPAELFGYGVAARIVSFRRLQQSAREKLVYLVALEGVHRIRIDKALRADPVLNVAVTVFVEKEIRSSEMTTLSNALRTAGLELTELLSQLQLPAQALAHLKQTIADAPTHLLADLLASMIDLSQEEKLDLLACVDTVKRVTRVVELVIRQIQVLKISQKIQTTVENNLGKQQREFILRQQLEAIKKELGESDSGSGNSESDPDLAALKSKLDSLQLPEDAAKIVSRELGRMARMPTQMPEHQVIRSYLEWMSEMPWNIRTGSDDIDIEKARMQLDADHYGMDGVKKRILEYLAVGKLKRDLKGPILCLLGPPGVGKTSLGKSIATALGRKFHRISLGGVRDEAEIRGHRRTYIGALPGLIVQGLKKCGSNDPVILLDEIDKLTRDNRGDPSAALLEVLDPEQNSTFTDHYLNVSFDLSKVLFIATANDADTISAPLLDRMEVIQLPSYTFPEKLEIARSHLVPKQLKAHGLDVLQTHKINITDQALQKIATEYTRESGVRGLDRCIAAVSRHLAVAYSRAGERFALDGFNGNVDARRVEEILGAPRFRSTEEIRELGVGVVAGLAWTPTGDGGVLVIEAVKVPSGSTDAHRRSNLVLTGKLGDVIKESAQLGVTWMRANSGRFGIDTDVLDGGDIHIHFPDGATPKDGPRYISSVVFSCTQVNRSAGITIVVALVSLFTNRPVRKFVAMTGEMTLRGRVQPVGGIKEKILAAHRSGIQRVILPSKNRKDAAEIPEEVRKTIELCFVDRIEEVLEFAFDENVFCVQPFGGGVYEAKL
ncbi:hypothetical protein HDU84_006765 [Entophlyctis sp. JEL0112]|nr:hypothetical protein HDU84_006765 [Entophlyctis sp. JEL0112]